MNFKQKIQAICLYNTYNAFILYDELNILIWVISLCLLNFTIRRIINQQFYSICFDALQNIYHPKNKCRIFV